MFSGFHNKGNWIQFERNPGDECLLCGKECWNSTLLYNCTWRSGGNTIARDVCVCERTYKLLVGQLTSILVTCIEFQEKILTVKLLLWNVAPEGGWRPSGGDDLKKVRMEWKVGETSGGSKFTRVHLWVPHVQDSNGKWSICWRGHFLYCSTKKKGNN